MLLDWLLTLDGADVGSEHCVYIWSGSNCLAEVRGTSQDPSDSRNTRWKRGHRAHLRRPPIGISNRFEWKWSGNNHRRRHRHNSYRRCINLICSRTVSICILFHPVSVARWMVLYRQPRWHLVVGKGGNSYRYRSLLIRADCPWCFVSLQSRLGLTNSLPFVGALHQPTWSGFCFDWFYAKFWTKK